MFDGTMGLVRREYVCQLHIPSPHSAPPYLTPLDDPSSSRLSLNKNLNIFALDVNNAGQPALNKHQNSFDFYF